MELPQKTASLLSWVLIIAPFVILLLPTLFWPVPFVVAAILFFAFPLTAIVSVVFQIIGYRKQWFSKWRIVLSLCVAVVILVLFVGAAFFASA